MRKQTDLVKVKQTALALLSTEINETPYSPMIVKHPFTDTGVSAIPDGKGGVEMIDLTEDDAQLRWRQSMARQMQNRTSRNQERIRQIDKEIADLGAKNLVITRLPYKRSPRSIRLLEADLGDQQPHHRPANREKKEAHRG